MNATTGAKTLPCQPEGNPEGLGCADLCWRHSVLLLGAFKKVLAVSWCLESRVTGWLLALLSSWRLFLPGDEDLLANLPLAPGRQKHQPLSWPSAKDKPEDTQQKETWGQPYSRLAKLSILGLWMLYLEFTERHSDDPAGFSSSGVLVFFPDAGIAFSSLWRPRNQKGITSCALLCVVGDQEATQKLFSFLKPWSGSSLRGIWANCLVFLTV